MTKTKHHSYESILTEKNNGLDEVENVVYKIIVHVMPVKNQFYALK